MTQGTKRVALLFLVATLLSVILLSSSLSNLQLQAGTLFPGAGPQGAAQPAISLEIKTYSTTILQGGLDLILLLLVVYVSIRLIALIPVKWIVRLTLTLVILLIVVIVLSLINFSPTGTSQEMVEIATLPSHANAISPPGRPPQEFTWFVAIGFALATGLIMIQIFRQQARRSHSDDPLLQEAKNAIRALESGKDFSDVIIRCYLQMMDALRKEHGIERGADTTAHEFEDWLEWKGFPRLPVHQLTSLFEKVRYAGQQVSKDEEKLALESLREIIHFAEGIKNA